MQGDRPFSDLNHGLSGWLDDTEKSVKSASSVAIRDLKEASDDPTCIPHLGDIALNLIEEAFGEMLFSIQWTRCGSSTSAIFVQHIAEKSALLNGVIKRDVRMRQIIKPV